MCECMDVGVMAFIITLVNYHVFLFCIVLFDIFVISNVMLYVNMFLDKAASRIFALPNPFSFEKKYV